MSVTPASSLSYHVEEDTQKTREKHRITQNQKPTSPKAKQTAKPRTSYLPLVPVLDELVSEWQGGALTDVSFVAAYILLLARQRYGGQWRTGRLQADLRERLCAVRAEAKEKGAVSELLLSNVKGLGDSLTEGEWAKVEGDTGRGRGHACVLDVWCCCAVRGMQSYVHEAIVYWDAGQRASRLMTSIPPPRAVLTMQCRGERCVTVFVSGRDIDTVRTDTYAPYASHDALDFVVHDLQHTEKFVHPDLHREQLGFFRCMHRTPRAHFGPYDSVFSLDVDHVTSDMNAAASHLLGFLKAKWIAAHHRALRAAGQGEGARLSEEEMSVWVAERFEPLLAHWGMPENIREAANRICTPQLTAGDYFTLRGWFMEMGEGPFQP